MLSLITATATAARLLRQIKESIRGCNKQPNTWYNVPHAKVGLLAGEELPQDDAEAVHISQDEINIGRLVEHLRRRPVDASGVVGLCAALPRVLAELGEAEI
jgi:hypothetical protein